MPKIARVILSLIMLAPTSTALAWMPETIYVQNVNPFENQNLVDALNGIRSSIDASTKAYQNTLLQQQLNSLDQSCVKQVVEHIRSKDTALATYDKQIDAYINGTMKTLDMSNPINAAQANAYLNSLYTIRNRQIDFYYQLVIDNCKGYVPPKPVTAQQQGIQCNGKSWNNCPAGQRFYCPATGDAQCIIDQPVTPTIKNVVPPVIPVTKPNNQNSSLCPPIGDGSDGSLVTSWDVKLTSDKNYTDLTIGTGHTFDLAGHHISCTGTFTINGTGRIIDSGKSGSIAKQRPIPVIAPAVATSKEIIMATPTPTNVNTTKGGFWSWLKSLFNFSY